MMTRYYWSDYMPCETGLDHTRRGLLLCLASLNDQPQHERENEQHRLARWEDIREYAQ